MKSRDILNRLNDEVDRLVDAKPSASITSTPINVARGGAPAPNPKPKRSFVHSRAFQAMCACMVCVAVLVGVLVPVLVTTSGVGGGMNDSTYVTMDINPSIDYVVDKDNKVVNMISRNNDGDLLLSHGFRESVIGKSIEDAIDMTLTKATELGFIDAKKLPTATTPSAVRIMATSDKAKRASEVLTSAKARAISHFKSNGIYMVVIGKEMDRANVLKASGLKSIDELSLKNKDKDGYYYINNVEGKTPDEVINAFKSDFAMSYMEDAFEELVEDIDDMHSLIADIEEIEADIREIERDAGLLPKDYWWYKVKPSVNDDIMEKVEEIDEKIAKFNETLDDEDSDDEDLIDINKVFDKIENKVDLDKAKALYKVYIEADIETKLERIFDRVQDNMLDINGVFDEIDSIVGSSLGKIGTAVHEISVKVKAKIDVVSNTASDYYDVCKEQIDMAYNNLIKRHQNNSGGVAIDDDVYEEYVESVMGDYDDIDDFWDAIHR